mmetsp:Transcript_7389/g.18356  ORF Transcript_7389/g.18356 Transcript_7389/m.18356 type:complete len:266 (-) Transcript_7389:1381-2178(-)
MRHLTGMPLEGHHHLSLTNKPARGQYQLKPTVPAEACKCKVRPESTSHPVDHIWPSQAPHHIKGRNRALYFLAFLTSREGRPFASGAFFSSAAGAGAAGLVGAGAGAGVGVGSGSGPRSSSDARRWFLSALRMSASAAPLARNLAVAVSSTGRHGSAPLTASTCDQSYRMLPCMTSTLAVGVAAAAAGSSVLGSMPAALSLASLSACAALAWPSAFSNVWLQRSTYFFTPFTWSLLTLPSTVVSWDVSAAWDSASGVPTGRGCST